MSEPPIPSIVWTIGSKIISYIIEKLKIDITFEKTARNPTIKVVRDTALIKYQLVICTHGIPKKYPKVTFSKVRGMGELLKKTVSPSNFGEVDGSLRLKLYTHEIPPDSEINIYVDFEVKVSLEHIINKDYMGANVLDSAHQEIEVLCSNNFNFPLEQVPVVVEKNERENLSSLRVLIIDRRSHNVIEELDSMATRKGDEYVKWYSSFKPNESILFKVVTTWA